MPTYACAQVKHQVNRAWDYLAVNPRLGRSSPPAVGSPSPWQPLHYLPQPPPYRQGRIVFLGGGNGRTLLLFLGNFEVGKRNREKIGWDHGGGRRTREKISHKVAGTFWKEGKMSLLPGGERCAGFGNGSYERFVVSKKGERMTSKEESKWRTER